MLIDHIVLNQCINVELLFEDGLDESDLICGLESLELHLARILVGQGLILVLQLHSDTLPLSLLVEILVVEEDKHDGFLVRCLDELESLSCQSKTIFQLTFEDIDSLGVDNEDVVRLSGSLGSGIESYKKLLCGVCQLCVMGRLLGSFTLIVSVVKLSETCPDNEIDCVGLLRPKCKVQGIIAFPVITQHLLL